jgi:hypothetical protein
MPKSWVWSYRDLFLSIEHRRGESEYKVVGSFEGKREEAELERPVSSEEIAGLWEGKGRAAQEIGNKLDKAVFSRDVLELLRTAKESLRPWQGLRLRFEAKSPEVSEWPFETLHDGKYFLALQKDCLIVRYQGSLHKMRTLWALPPLRVLVVVSSPASLEWLDVDLEWNAIQETLEPLRRKGKVEVERLDTPTTADLAAKLGEKKYHVLHFIGHGAFTRAEGGVIYLAGPGGNAQSLTGDALAVLLGPDSSIRLVVLNTCEGALTRGDGFSGVAQALIQQGIPAVLAMQGKIPDPAAFLFSRRFYERLSKGRPIDRALRKVRYELFAAEPYRAEWAMPVLFLGAKNGKLFTWLPSWRSIVAFLLIVSSVTVFYLVKPWKPRCPTPRAVDMDFVWIEPTPGSNIVKPYCLGAREVSRGEWKAVRGANSLPAGQSGDDDLPVGASYPDAEAFLNEFNALEGTRVYRLPTDAEWGHAALGPGTSEGGNCKGKDKYDDLAPVGSFLTNDLGLYDMIGNVWEWVDAPADAEGRRIHRGGAYDTTKSCTVGPGSRVLPENTRKNTGFRVAFDAP